MHILFTGTESTFGYFEAHASTSQETAFYSDKASIFRINQASEIGGAGHTQFDSAANAFMPACMMDYNSRFARVPREVHDAHRPIRADEDLDSIFAWPEQRKVTSSLTLHYERKLSLLADNKQNRRLAGKYVDVYQYPDGRIEIKAAGESLPYSTYDKLVTPLSGHHKYVQVVEI